ncbi:phosphatase PAP2 family protein [Micromonospora sp. NPDC049523]|uniref:phosphatase PAP2 family protein n=1 Tax=Micromonospora sp. NPDC049523 TaxID=3155921 RepID=UPI003426E0CE
MHGRRTALTVAWLVLLTAVQGAAFVLLWRFAVRTEHGQLLDTIALTGNKIGQDRIDGLVGTVLDAMSVVSLVAATLVIGFIALIRGRVALAVVATLLVVGANVTTQVAKYVIHRPDFGVDPERAAAGNSLPSGHTTIAAAVAVALVLVLPPRVRAWGALLAVAYTALAGVATLSAGWHRPSDAVASLLIVGAWAAVAGILLLIFQREDAQVEPGDAHWRAVTLFGLAGLALLAVAGYALYSTDEVLGIPVEELNRPRLFDAYLGGAAAIAGTASLMMSLLLVSVHRVVPRHNG